MLVFAPQLHHLPAPLQLLYNHLNPPPTVLPLPSTFRIHAWRWHHLALESHLSTLAALPLSTPTPALTAAYSFVLTSNWDVHDLIESVHLSALTAVPPSVSASRRRLRRAREALRADLARNTVSRADAARRLRALTVDASSAFAESERLLIPALAAVPREEQDRFNSRVVRTLGQGRARVALTLFYDALFVAADAGERRRDPGSTLWRKDAALNRATPEDRRIFKRAIPAPVRALLPMWLRGLTRTHPILFDKRKVTVA